MKNKCSRIKALRSAKNFTQEQVADQIGVSRQKYARIESGVNSIDLFYANKRMTSFTNAVDVLQGHFVSKEEEYQKYCRIDIVNNEDSQMLHRMMGFAEYLKHMEFNRQVEDIIEVGLRRYKEKYHVCRTEESPFVLYEKYSRRDVSLLMNCGKDLSSTMYGMKCIGDDVFIFVTYHKEESADDEKAMLTESRTTQMYLKITSFLDGIRKLVEVWIAPTWKMSVPQQESIYL